MKRLAFVLVPLLALMIGLSVSAARPCKRHVCPSPSPTRTPSPSTTPSPSPPSPSPTASPTGRSNFAIIDETYGDQTYAQWLIDNHLATGIDFHPPMTSGKCAFLGATC